MSESVLVSLITFIMKNFFFKQKVSFIIQFSSPMIDTCFCINYFFLFCSLEHKFPDDHSCTEVHDSNILSKSPQHEHLIEIIS